MNSIFVSTDRVGRAGAEVVDIAAELDHEIGALRVSLEQIQAGWSSDRAAPRFAGVLLDYLADAAALRKSLTDQGHALTHTGQVFDQTETDVADSFGGGR